MKGTPCSAAKQPSHLAAPPARKRGLSPSPRIWAGLGVCSDQSDKRTNSEAPAVCLFEGVAETPTFRSPASLLEEKPRPTANSQDRPPATWARRLRTSNPAESNCVSEASMASKHCPGSCKIINPCSSKGLSLGAVGYRAIGSRKHYRHHQ